MIGSSLFDIFGISISFQNDIVQGVEDISRSGIYC